MSDKRAALRREQRDRPKTPMIDRTVVIEPGDTAATVMGKICRADILYGRPITVQRLPDGPVTLPTEVRGESVLSRYARVVDDWPLYAPRIVSQDAFAAIVISGLPLAYIKDDDHKT